jgi:hypothetical protein
VALAGLVLGFAAPASALPFEGLNSWWAPCLLDAHGANIDPMGPGTCFGPTEAVAMRGRPYTFRFAARRTAVASEGWDRSARMIGYLNAHNARGLPILTTEGLNDEEHPSQVFRDYVHAAIAHLPTPVLEIGNEPNTRIGSEFGQTPTAYGQRLCDAYGGWRDAGSPARVTLMTGGLATPNRAAALAYLSGAKVQFDRSCGVGAWSRFSAVSVHTYSAKPFAMAGTVVATRTWLRRHDLGRLTIDVTEYGWSSGLFGQRGQRANQVEFQRWAYASARDCGISGAYWFGLRDAITPNQISHRTLGLMRHDGTPKASFRSWSAFLGDHSIVGDDIPSPNLHPYRHHLAAHSAGPTCRRTHP